MKKGAGIRNYLIRGYALTAMLVISSGYPSVVAAKHHYKKYSPYIPFAQDGLGGITGRIMGNLVPVRGATVELMRKGRLIDKTTTDDEGTFIFRYFDTGEYRIVATRSGFRTSEITEIPVVPDQLTLTDFYMPILNTPHMSKTTLSEPFVENWRYSLEN